MVNTKNMNDFTMWGETIEDLEAQIMQVCKYASMQVFKYANMEVCTYESMHICKYAHMQVSKYASLVWFSLVFCVSAR